MDSDGKPRSCNSWAWWRQSIWLPPGGSFTLGIWQHHQPEWQILRVNQRHGILSIRDQRLIPRRQPSSGIFAIDDWTWIAWQFVSFSFAAAVQFVALAWVAPAPWLLLVRQRELTGKRPYRALWLAGFLFWLAAIHWLRLPHWTTYFGWLALSFYLAFYLPVFIGLSRVAVQRLGISIVVAAPVVWTGLELARGHLLSGFTMGALSHTQIRWPAVIQIADIIGDYGVSGLVVFVAACVTRMIPWRGQRFAVWPVVPLAAVLGAAVGYGHWRMAGDHTRPGPTVALIQGSIDAELKTDEKQQNAVLDEYLQLSKRALTEQPNLDLLVWPETMYRYPLFTFADGFQARRPIRLLNPMNGRMRA